MVNAPRSFWDFLATAHKGVTSFFKGPLVWTVLDQIPYGAYMNFRKFSVLLPSLNDCISKNKKSCEKIKYTRIIYCSWNVDFRGLFFVQLQKLTELR